MTATTTTALPKNITGVFAGNSLKEIKPTRNQTNVVLPLALQYRQAGSANVLMNQNRLSRNPVQSYHPQMASSGVRNGFRPSTVRHQKSRPSTAMTPRDSHHRDARENSSKDLFLTTPSSARLKSEIDQLNSQLKIYGDLNKILRLQNDRVCRLNRECLLNTLRRNTPCR